MLCLGWNVRLIAYVGQWVTNKIYSVHFLTVSVSFLIIKNVIGSVGHHQFYINWSSAPYSSYIQTFKRIRECPTAGVPNYLGSVVMYLTRHYVMTDCKLRPQLGQAIPC